MSATMRLRFQEGDCPDCHRPPNAGGIHNHGCRLSSYRHCLLCYENHSGGDDCHTVRDGSYCSHARALRLEIERCPGLSREECERRVNERVRAMAQDIEIVNWLRDNPNAVEMVLAAARCINA